MADHLELKKINPVAIPAALEKAERYRLLNEPEQAESICLDVLAVDSQNQRARKMLVLALTDQFLTRAAAAKQARAQLAELSSEYEQIYYTGLICEREARAHLTRGVSAAFAHDLFLEAIELYGRAEGLAPEGNNDPILRRNSCLRTMAGEGLEPLMQSPSELPLE